MSSYEATAICNVIVYQAKHSRNRPVTFNQLQQQLNASIEFIKVNAKDICKKLLQCVDVIDVDVYDDMFDIIVK